MIEFIYGSRQCFRYRYKDVNVIGATSAPLPAQRAMFSLNGSESRHFYIEPSSVERSGKFPYGRHTPSVHRLREQPGHFNLEVSVSDPFLRKGNNKVQVVIDDHAGVRYDARMEFDWDPRPVSFPLDLTDLSSVVSVQEIGQIVNGAFDVDAVENVIRARAPVGADILLLLGSPAGSQEATYRVRFGGRGGVFLGLSDFFVGHEVQDGDLGIKPGYSTAGLATVDPFGSAKIWLAWGDNLIGNSDTWVISTPTDVCGASIRIGVDYRVRHQLIIKDDFCLSRFRIWREGRTEPSEWICEEHTARLSERFNRHVAASFGLFQYFGTPTQWSDVVVQEIESASLHRPLGYKASRFGRMKRKLRRQIESRARALAIQARDQFRSSR